MYYSVQFYSSEEFKYLSIEDYLYKYAYTKRLKLHCYKRKANLAIL